MNSLGDTLQTDVSRIAKREIIIRSLRASIYRSLVKSIVERSFS